LIPTQSCGTFKSAAPEPSASSARPPVYELIEEIGHSGMGFVYRARDSALDRDIGYDDWTS
jgi:hypothetical protein